MCFPLFQSHLFSKVNIPASGILTIDSSLPVTDCAEDYERKLKEVLHFLNIQFGFFKNYLCFYSYIDWRFVDISTKRRSSAGKQSCR